MNSHTPARGIRVWMLMLAVGIIAIVIVLGKWSLAMFAISESYRAQANKGRAYAAFFQQMASEQRKPEPRAFLLRRAQMELADTSRFDRLASFPWLTTRNGDIAN